MKILLGILFSIAIAVCLYGMFAFALVINKSLGGGPLPWTGIGVIVIGTIVLCLMAKK